MSQSSSSSLADVAVLVSGGLDSAILTVDLARRGHLVHPIYISTSLVWEAAELHHLRQFLEAIPNDKVQSLTLLKQPTDDLYNGHWSVNGIAVPDAATPDEAVYLPGRNPLLLVKAIVWCRLHGVDRLALAPLSSNPFPDATPEFFDNFAEVMSQATGGRIEIWRPFAALHKREVMRLANGLPLNKTFSCIQPAGLQHCGQCNKCAERQAAFKDSGIVDPTIYVHREKN